MKMLQTRSTEIYCAKSARNDVNKLTAFYISWFSWFFFVVTFVTNWYDDCNCGNMTTVTVSRFVTVVFWTSFDEDVCGVGESCTGVYDVLTAYVAKCDWLRSDGIVVMVDSSLTWNWAGFYRYHLILFNNFLWHVCHCRIEEKQRDFF